MSETNRDESAWQTCAPGELQQLATSLRRRERREKVAQVARVGTWSLLVMAVGVFLVGWNMSGGDVRVGGITCATCQAQFRPYHDHLLDQARLDETVAHQMREHLANCPICAELFQSRYPGVLRDQASRLGWQTQLLASRQRNRWPVP